MNGAVVRIEPRGRLWSVGWRELWSYRELLYFLVWRDVKVRYKQTVLGAAWAILQPALTMVVFTFVFSRFAGVPSQGVPYPIFALAALLPWGYVAGAVGRSGVSVVSSANLVSKVYFPRLIIPVAAAAAPLVDFAIGFGLLAAGMAWYGVVPGWRLLLLPALVAWAFLTALAVSLWLSAANVRYRDVTYIIPFFVQIWMFISPVAYPSSLVPARWRPLYDLNPVAGIVEGFRWCLFRTSSGPPAASILTSVAVVLVLLASGLVYFHATEDTFADVI